MDSRQLLKSLNSAIRSFRNYKAAIVPSTASNIQIRDVKDITPHGHEVLVKVETAGVNYTDLMMLNGSYHLQPQAPFTLGYEMMGTIQSVGKNVEKWKEGDRVLCLKLNGTGAFAELCTVNEQTDVVLPLSYSIDADLAPSIAAYGSAYLGMKRLAMERRGNSFLILTSRGTLGLATMDLAQNVFEGVVFGASDSESKLEYLREANVLSTFNWTDGQLVKNVHKQTFGKGVDYVIDTVGGQIFHQGVQCLKAGGHIISLGFSSGIIPQLDILKLHQYNASVTGIWLGGREKKEIEESLTQVIHLLDQGFLKGLKINKYSLDDLSKCLEDMKEPEFFGKAVITLYDY